MSDVICLISTLIIILFLKAVTEGQPVPTDTQHCQLVELLNHSPLMLDFICVVL